MRKVYMLVFGLAAVAAGAPSAVWSQAFPSALAGNIAAAPGARVDSKGDWRRHEIVRIWRDESGCRLSVVSYHRPNGDIDSRQTRECGKD
ncbi:hypothetical protein M2323_002906 [Rhodoblastus acidophilus]|uniref:hypothetical protein n=1 Tax=Rhodoblastus acidophilus TaxID=1074 RepID=UPI002225077E|nr:hypothetical protein [Rhodoblastus acidophilus]MCW2284967.1 hypothetical protein [Rhodoblastus acidophilus]MCW2333969.1 hypothetical protein [Rhodoblastus acidophilus]